MNSEHHKSVKVNIHSAEWEEKRRVLSPPGGAFNYMVFAVGTALVATPWNFSIMTLPFGIFTEFLLAFLAFCSGICIFNATSITNATSMPDLGLKIFGNDLKGKLIVLILITIPGISLLISSLSAYIVIASDIAALYLGISVNTFKIIFTIFIGFLGTLNSFQKTKYIAYFGFCTFVIIVIISTIVAIQMMEYLIDVPQRQFNFSNMIQAIPVMAFGFNALMPLPGIASEMSEKSQQQFYKFFALALTLIVILNTTAGVAPERAFGIFITGDSLTQMGDLWNQMFNNWNTLVLIAHILLAIVLLAQAPVFIIPLKEFILDRNGLTVQDRSLITNLLVSMIYSIISGGITLVLTQLTEVVTVVGGIGAFMLSGPAAAYISYKTETSTNSKFRQVISLVFGTTFLAVNIYSIWYTAAIPDSEKFPHGYEDQNITLTDLLPNYMKND